MTSLAAPTSTAKAIVPGAIVRLGSGRLATIVAVDAIIASYKLLDGPRYCPDCDTESETDDHCLACGCIEVGIGINTVYTEYLVVVS